MSIEWFFHGVSATAIVAVVLLWLDGARKGRW